MPAASGVRVERQGTVNQRHHRANVLSEIGQREGGIREDARIVAGFLKGSSCELSAFQSICLPIFAPVVPKKPNTAVRRPSECRPVMRITCDRLLRQTERL